jgi:hypothetical protein
MDKQQLKDYKRLREEIECEQERLEMMELKILGLSASNNSGMPRASSSEYDKIATNIVRKTDIENNLARLLKKEKEERNKIEKEIDERLEYPDERMLIRLRYIDCMSWREISELMYAKRRDYYEEEDKYKRRVYRIHGKALIKLAK